MATPRHDRWTVQGWKPRNIALFDSLIDQPFKRSTARFMRWQGSSELLCEMFQTEEDARNYADLARAAGAIQVNILPPAPMDPDAKPIRLRRSPD